MALDFVPIEYRVKFRGLLGKYEKTIFTVIALIVFIVAVFLAARFFLFYTSKNKEAPQLYSIAFQDVDKYKNNTYTSNIYASWDDIDDMIQANKSYKEEKVSFQNYQQLLANPYNYYLQYQYLPRLNVWKDPYTNEIDTELIGDRFLSENPFTDLNLINAWVDIFENIGEVASDLGVSAQNKVSDVTIAPIKEFDNGFFAIPMDLTFESSDRRSLLLLMEKLGMTSHHENIALINEFFFNVWENIKKEYAQELEASVINVGIMEGETNVDKKLGYLMDQWLLNNGPNFVDDRAQKRRVIGREDVMRLSDLIELSIRESAGCTDQGKMECEFLFREKFRTLPFLIYPLTNDRKSKSTEFKKFFVTSLPPVIKIGQFSFNVAGDRARLSEESRFQGRLAIEVFGRGVSNDEINEIAVELGKKCYTTSNLTMSVEQGLKTVNERIVQISQIDALDTERAKELFELRDIMTNMSSNYNNYTPFNKVIKLFEVYRMLDEGNLCEK